MLKFTLLAPALGATLMLSSCSPYVEAPVIPDAPADPALNVKKESKSITDKKQKSIKKARETASSTKPKSETSSSSSSSSNSSASTKPKPKKRSYPVATPVPGKDGYVFSPYNNKVINIQGLPSGSVVKDPNDPVDAKRYFRVP